MDIDFDVLKYIKKDVVNISCVFLRLSRETTQKNNKEFGLI